MNLEEINPFLTQSPAQTIVKKNGYHIQTVLSKVVQCPNQTRQIYLLKIWNTIWNTRVKTLKMLKQSGKRRKIVFLNLQQSGQALNPQLKLVQLTYLTKITNT